MVSALLWVCISKSQGVAPPQILKVHLSVKLVLESTWLDTLTGSVSETARFDHTFSCIATHSNMLALSQTREKTDPAVANHVLSVATGCQHKNTMMYRQYLLAVSTEHKQNQSLKKDRSRGGPVGKTPWGGGGEVMVVWGKLQSQNII